MRFVEAATFSKNANNRWETTVVIYIIWNKLRSFSSASLCVRRSQESLRHKSMPLYFAHYIEKKDYRILRVFDFSFLDYWSAWKFCGSCKEYKTTSILIFITKFPILKSFEKYSPIKQYWWYIYKYKEIFIVEYYRSFFVHLTKTK